MIESVSLHFVAFQCMTLAQILAHDNGSGNVMLPSTIVKADVAEW
jgi:hypothetical protein